MKCFVSYCFLILGLSSAMAQVTNVNHSPEKQVAQVLETNSSMVDAIVEQLNWDGFESIDAVNRIVDLNNVDYNLLNAALVYFTNKFRKKKRKKSLNFSPELRDAAVFHSLEMVNRKFYSHKNVKNRKYKEPWDRTQYFHFPRSSIGENIAKEYFSKNTTYIELANRIVQSWIDSKPHRENILHSSFKYLGCGVIITEEKNGGQWLATATQNFGGVIQNR